MLQIAIDENVRVDDLTLDAEKELNIRLNKNVGEWDGNSITYIDDSLFHSVTDVCYYHNQLYIAGKIKTTNPVAPISVVRKRTDKGWEVVSDIFDDFIRTMERHDSSLIFGGTFEKHGNQIVNHIICWQSQKPHQLRFLI